MPRDVTEAEISASAKELEDACATLDETLTYLRHRMSGALNFGGAEIDANAAVLGHLRALVLQAEAILKIARTDFSHASTSNLRTMYEAWMELRVLLASPDRQAAGFRFGLFGLLEFRDFRVARGDTPEELVDIDERLRRYQVKNASMYEQVIRDCQDAKKPAYASGSRAAVLSTIQKTDKAKTAKQKSEAVAAGMSPKEVDAVPNLFDIYKFLSWDTHGVINMLEAEFDDDRDTVSYFNRQSSADAGEFTASMANALLADAWHSVKAVYSSVGE